MQFSMLQKLLSECLGTLLLVCTVVGSGIMAERLTQDVALALLGNTLATGAILVVLITVLGSVSGAHFNPAVSLIFLLKGQLKAKQTGLFILAQCVGGILGTLLAHAMFELPLIDWGQKMRSGSAQWLSEAVATFGLVLTILGCVRFKAESVAMAVGLYITAAYWFTASTSFANPAVTLARAFTNSFSNIQPADILPFVAAQLLGAILALLATRVIFNQSQKM